MKTESQTCFSPVAYPLNIYGELRFSVIPAELVTSTSLCSFLANTKGELHVPDDVLAFTKLAFLSEVISESGDVVACRVTFMVGREERRVLWFDVPDLKEFFMRYRDSFLWVTRDNVGLVWCLLVRMFRDYQEVHGSVGAYAGNLSRFYQSTLGDKWDPNIQNLIERSVDKHFDLCKRRGDMSREESKKRGICAKCPGAGMCWGGEKLIGIECVICGRLLIGRGQLLTGPDVAVLPEPLGELPEACPQVEWKRVVCKECDAPYRAQVNEELYTLLQQYETSG